MGPKCLESYKEMIDVQNLVKIKNRLCAIKNLYKVKRCVTR